MSAYDELRRESGPCVLLESTGPPGPLARLSILARRPRAVLVADRAGATLSGATGTRRVDADPVAALRGLLREVRRGHWPDEGGVAGALAYDSPGRGAPPPGPCWWRWPWTASRSRRWWERRIRPPAGGATAGRIDLPAFSNMSRDDHRRRVLRIKEHIAAGDIYQANLSQRFELPFDRGGPGSSTATSGASAPPRSRATFGPEGSRSPPPRPSGS